MIPETGKPSDFKKAVLEHCSQLPTLGEVYAINGPREEWKCVGVYTKLMVFKKIENGITCTLDYKTWAEWHHNAKFLRMDYDP